MIALATAWTIIGSITFLAILIEHMQDRTEYYGSPLCWEDAWGIPAGLALLIICWPVAYARATLTELNP